MNVFVLVIIFLLFSLGVIMMLIYGVDCKSECKSDCESDCALLGIGLGALTGIGFGVIRN